MRYSSRMASFHVLLIEDDPTTVFAMSVALADAGHVVSSATSVREAVDALSGGVQHDVILSDLRLGPDRGEEVFAELRRRDIPFGPVVIVSAQTESEIERAARVIPAQKTLRKPVSIDIVCGAMEQVVRRSA